jgi:hypothetical protein
MIITEPVDFAGEIHDRMPAFLLEKKFGPRLSVERKFCAGAERFFATLATVEAGRPLKD